jgi:hypothetical protein
MMVVDDIEVRAAMDGRVHHQVLSTILHQGYPPSTDELAGALATSREEVENSLRRLHEGHGLVLHPGSVDLWIAHPFSASPSAVWITAGSRSWWAPCIWCAMGIATLAAPTATIHVRYAGEHEEARIEVRNNEVVPDEVVVHFATAPRDAWRNVVHWCATVLPFRTAKDISAWCERHRIPRGAVVPVNQVLALTPQLTWVDPPRFACRAISSLRTRLVRPVSDLRRASTSRNRLGESGQPR